MIQLYSQNSPPKLFSKGYDDLDIESKLLCSYSTGFPVIVYCAVVALDLYLQCILRLCHGLAAKAGLLMDKTKK